MTKIDARLLASRWFHHCGKHPKLIKDGESIWMWRWVLPEPGRDDSTSELPEPVFQRLVGGSPQPWIFGSRNDAIDAAITAATIATITDAWSPNKP